MDTSIKYIESKANLYWLDCDPDPDESYIIIITKLYSKPLPINIYTPPITKYYYKIRYSSINYLCYELRAEKDKDKILYLRIDCNSRTISLPRSNPNKALLARPAKFGNNKELIEYFNIKFNG